MFLKSWFPFLSSLASISVVRRRSDFNELIRYNICICIVYIYVLHLYKFICICGFLPKTSVYVTKKERYCKAQLWGLRLILFVTPFWISEKLFHCQFSGIKILLQINKIIFYLLIQFFEIPQLNKFQYCLDNVYKSFLKTFKKLRMFKIHGIFFFRRNVHMGRWYIRIIGRN